MRTNKKQAAHLRSLLLALIMVLDLFPGMASAAGNHAPEYQFGKVGAQTALIPGVYELPVEMKKETSMSRTLWLPAALRAAPWRL